MVSSSQYSMGNRGILTLTTVWMASTMPALKMLCHLRTVEPRCDCFLTPTSCMELLVSGCNAFFFLESSGGTLPNSTLQANSSSSLIASASAWENS
ncbi:hypothetical protein RHMOL_Rhmol04G0234000 [Rhododendron molle]|uniref:Uncharacterized protein n=1 Tax=Rhododendron molle TaxID=49168 RepID=A0ACC0P3S3_RHOML|nr:hypothetical protein RHMOL_Rhmol04G0234000 [Rhododendron molle]